MRVPAGFVTKEKSSIRAIFLGRPPGANRRMSPSRSTRSWFDGNQAIWFGGSGQRSLQTV